METVCSSFLSIIVFSPPCIQSLCSASDWGAELISFRDKKEKSGKGGEMHLHEPAAKFFTQN